MKGLHCMEQFPMKKLKRERTIWIYLPPSYEQGGHYPVLYMQDGQNLFEEDKNPLGAIWNVPKKLDELYEEKQIPEMIVVGIESDKSKRYLEYSPWENKSIGTLMPHAALTDGLGGEGFTYLEFIVKELKPYIDSHYNTLRAREFTAIAGSSMGALISVTAALQYQEIFGMAGSLSSAAYFCEEDFFQYLSKVKKKEDIKWYLDVGTEETSNALVPEFPQIYMNTTEKIRDGLKQAGWTNEQIYHQVFDGDYHSEVCWERRFPIMLKFLFG